MPSVVLCRAEQQRGGGVPGASRSPSRVSTWVQTRCPHAGARPPRKMTQRLPPPTRAQGSKQSPEVGKHHHQSGPTRHFQSCFRVTETCPAGRSNPSTGHKRPSPGVKPTRSEMHWTRGRATRARGPRRQPTARPRTPGLTDEDADSGCRRSLCSGLCLAGLLTLSQLRFSTWGPASSSPTSARPRQCDNHGPPIPLLAQSTAQAQPHVGCG